MLTLRGIDYGNIFCAPGARGFFGEGYPFHHAARALGMYWGDDEVPPGDSQHIGFVSKTIVYPPRAGNMPLRGDNLTPREILPRSVIVKFRSGHVLNAVGLSGPGAKWALSQGRWQAMTTPFMISFMSAADTPDERLIETKLFADLIKTQLGSFHAPFAIQANRACPNTGHVPDEFYPETTAMLDILGEIGVPVVVNYNPTVPLEVMRETSAHEACDALWIANTIPWGDYRIDWQQLFGTTQSPLEARKLPVSGAGGLSGPACLSWTFECLRIAREGGVTVPIVAGNGIQHPVDVYALLARGADAVAIGSVGIVRPWRMRSIIKAANIWDWV